MGEREDRNEKWQNCGKAGFGRCSTESFAILVIVYFVRVLVWSLRFLSQPFAPTKKLFIEKGAAERGRCQNMASRLKTHKAQESMVGSSTLFFLMSHGSRAVSPP